MRRVCIRFRLRVVLAVTGLALGMSATTSLRAQAQAPERVPRFEVASIRQNTSGGRRQMLTQPGGGLVITNVLVKGLIAEAFSVPRDRLLGGPDWIESERYDISAKAPAEWQLSPLGPPRELLLMVRSLLEDRFVLKAHLEKRDRPVYELVMAKADRTPGPGLRKSDVDCDAIIKAALGGASLPQRQPGEPPPCGLMGGPSSTLAAGVTLEQLAANLATRLDRPVIDRTGLTGRFAFTLRWTPVEMPTAPLPPGLAPIDPNGPSLFVALEEQLGVRLQSATGRLDVVVVDGVQRPTPD